MLDGKASFHVVVVFLLVHMFATSCSRRAERSSCVPVLSSCKLIRVQEITSQIQNKRRHLQDTHIFLVEMFEHALQVGKDKVEPALVLVLLLRPHHIGVGILQQFITDEIKRKRTQLLNASNGHLVIESTGITFLDEFIVHFARTENLTLNCFRSRLDLLALIRQKSSKLSSWQQLIK